MPIKTLQKRLTEVGRLRMGRKVPTRGGKTRPERLAEWRLTSAHPDLLEHAANLYGGDVQPWADAPTEHPQYELYTDASAIKVLVPPGHTVSQWMEAWSGGGCQRRCDGEREYLTDQDCLCAAQFTRPQDYPCKPTTRLAVVLRDIPAVGVWRLEVHGYYGAVELAGMAQLLEDAGLSGRVVPAELRIEQRSIKRPGEPPKRFAVPVLSPESAFLELVVAEQRAALELGRHLEEIEAPDYDSQTGEVYEQADDPGRVGGDPAAAHPAGSGAATPTPGVPTVEQIRRLRKVEDAKRLVQQAGASYQLHVQAAVSELDNRVPKLFWEQETEVRVWRDVLEYAVELHEQQTHETSAVGVPPPAADPPSEEAGRKGKADQASSEDPTLLEGGEAS